METRETQIVRLVDQAQHLRDAIGAVQLAVNGIDDPEPRVAMTWILERVEKAADALWHDARRLHEEGGAFERGIQQLREAGIER